MKKLVLLLAALVLHANGDVIAQCSSEPNRIAIFFSEDCDDCANCEPYYLGGDIWAYVVLMNATQAGGVSGYEFCLCNEDGTPLGLCDGGFVLGYTYPPGALSSAIEPCFRVGLAEPLPYSPCITLLEIHFMITSPAPWIFGVKPLEDALVPGAMAYADGIDPGLLIPMYPYIEPGEAMACLNCSGDLEGIPTCSAEPEISTGTANTINWADGGPFYLAQCAEDALFSTGVRESVRLSGHSHTFTDLQDGQLYFYRVKSVTICPPGEESEWSNVESSTQDDLAPESSAGPLPAYQGELSFEVPWTGSDSVSGVASVELFRRLLWPQGAAFGWEDGTSTALDSEGGPVLRNSTDRSHDGDRSLRIGLGSLGSGGKAYLAWVRDLAEGDEVSAGFWCYDPSAFGDPSSRIRAHWNDDPSDVSVDDGDAGGDQSYSQEYGWSHREHVWTVPAGHAGLMIEADVIGDLGDQVYVDDLELSVPGTATVMLPDGSVTEPTTWQSCGSHVGSPITVEVPGEGLWGFYTVATDAVGNVEEAPADPDATTTVVLSTAVPGEPARIPRFVLHQNSPNPFNPITTIRYELSVDARVKLCVYDVTGSLVCSLMDGVAQGAGHHEVVWRGRGDDGRSVPSGTYFYRLTAGGYSEMRKMVLVK